MPAGDLSKAKRGLEALDKKFRNKLCRDAVRKACKILAKQVQANAPVETGALKKSVKVRAGKRKKDVISMLVIVTGGHDQPIPGHVEYGTSKTKPRPFFNPAIESKLPEMEATVIGEITSGIGD